MDCFALPGSTQSQSDSTRLTKLLHDRHEGPSRYRLQANCEETTVFEQLQQKAWFPSPQAGFVGFAGCVRAWRGIGKIAGGAKPWDWTLTVANFAALALYTCWFGIAVIRKLPRRKAPE